MTTTALGKGWASTAKIVDKKPFYSTVASSETLETKEYEHFTCHDKNRPIQEDKIKFFMKQFNHGKFFMKEFPVVVDKNHIILDGQHRFEAVRRLGLPLYFKYADTLTLDNIVDVQINAGWTTSDYLHTFIQQGNQNYIILHRFIERYKINTGVAIQLLAGAFDGLKKSGYYDGSFVVRYETQAHERAKVLNKIGELSGGLNRDRGFCSALIIIISHPEWEEKRMVEQMTKYASLMRRQVTKEAYLRNLEEVYNYKLYNKNKVRFI